MSLAGSGRTYEIEDADLVGENVDLEDAPPLWIRGPPAHDSDGRSGGLLIHSRFGVN
jgi:hypothetical protein